MDEQLQSKLVEILSGIQSATKAAGDFALEQLPDIAQSYVVYGRAIYTFHILVGVAALFVCVWLAGTCKRGIDVRNSAGLKWSFDNKPGVMTEGQVFLAGFSAFAAGFVGFWIIGGASSSAFLVWFAPKVWLIKELAGFIK